MRIIINIYKNRVAVSILKNITEEIPMNRALDIAYFLIAQSGERGISNLKLQKMLYFVQRNEIQNGRIAFQDRIEAWKFGPVIPNVYYEFSGRGSLPITANEIPYVPQLDENLGNIITEIFNQWFDRDVWEMVRATHREGGAWFNAFVGNEGLNNVIRVEDIRQEVNNDG